MDKILTIAIPIYNCEDSIEKNLYIIKNEIKNRDDVEIVISDNASTDNSLKVIEKIVREDRNIKVLTSKENCGMDKNVFKVCQASTGKFVHIMSADDFYVEGAIDRLIQVIGKYPDLDVIVLSNNYLNVFTNEIIDNHGIENDILCKQGGELLENEELKMLCLSNIVVARKKIDEIKNWNDGIGLLWPHLFIVRSVLDASSKCFVFSYNNPLITVQLGNQEWVKKDAICTYYRAIVIYEQMIKKCNGCGSKSIKTFLTSVISPKTQKSGSLITNLKIARDFLPIYKSFSDGNGFIKWLRFALILIIYPKKSFFDNINRSKEE